MGLCFGRQRLSIYTRFTTMCVKVGSLKTVCKWKIKHLYQIVCNETTTNAEVTQTYWNYGTKKYVKLEKHCCKTTKNKINPICCAHTITRLLRTKQGDYKRKMVAALIPNRAYCILFPVNNFTQKSRVPESSARPKSSVGREDCGLRGRLVPPSASRKVVYSCTCKMNEKIQHSVDWMPTSTNTIPLLSHPPT